MEAHQCKRKVCVLLSLFLLAILHVLTPVARAQPFRGDYYKQRPSTSGLYQVYRNGNSGQRRIGFINKTGKLVIGFETLPERIIYVGEFHEGRAVIHLKKEVAGREGFSNWDAGYIDEAGKVVIAPDFDYASDFNEGLAYVSKGAFRGFIDRKGRIVFKLEQLNFFFNRSHFYSPKTFHEGRASVGTYPGYQGGYIDRSGRLVIKPQYDRADDFSEGLAAVALHRQYGFINKEGEMVIRPRFRVADVGSIEQGAVKMGRFSEGLACVMVENPRGPTGTEHTRLYGFIDRNGEFVIPPQFSQCQEFSEGLAWVVTGDYKNLKAGWIDRSGRWAVSGVGGRTFSAEFPEFIIYANPDYDWRYSEGLVPFVVLKGKEYLFGYMNRKGEVVIQPGFISTHPFVGGIARVWLEPSPEGPYGYIDRTGRFIWRP